MGSAECPLIAVKGYRLSVIRKKVIALVLCIGALPFVMNAPAYAYNGEGQTAKGERKLIDELTYNAQARIQTSYLWRGLYCGGPNIQASANIGFYGVYADMWWNIGATDIRFSAFQPEVDLSVGFNRWGLDVYLLYIYNFNCGFFDGGNYIDKGNRLELNVKYTIPKTHLTIAWASRVAASDCYQVERVTDEGLRVTELVRAYSSYAEISYNQPLKDGWSVFGAIGVTPWKGCYNPNGAALQNIEVRVRKDWHIARHTGIMLQGQMAVNPMTPIHVINLNATVGVFLR